VKARVQKWGNSLGIRIPRALALEVNVAADSEVEISAKDGKILISPLRRRVVSLRDLLSKVTDSNLHEEVTTGRPLGKESW